MYEKWRQRRRKGKHGEERQVRYARPREIRVKFIGKAGEAEES